MQHPELLDEKKFYERFHALHDDPDLLAVFKRYGTEAFRRSSVLEGFAEFLDRQQVRGDTCVEIGTLTGLTAIVLARRFRRVITIDVVRHPLTDHVASGLGVDNIEFVLVKDNAAKAAFISELQFDAAYLDGDHARDTASDFDLVKRCGRVLFHEYWSAQPAVFDLVNRLKLTGKVVTQGKLALWTN